jgi:phosphoenolpyruvate carboxylase
LVDEITSKFSADRTELVKKHNDRWRNKFNGISRKRNNLLATTKTLQEKIAENNKKCLSGLEIYHSMYNQISNALHNLQEECTNKKVNDQTRLKKDITKAQTEVNSKLTQLHKVLIKIQNDSSKDDRFTKLIKTILVGF